MTGMKRVLITGASGFLGHLLADAFLRYGDTEVIAIMGKPGDKGHPLPDSQMLKTYPCSSLMEIECGHIDTLIHTAFSRGDHLPGLSGSIGFSEQIIEWSNSRDVDSIINISSQGVYKALLPGEIIDETGPVEPDTVYGLAKWAVENMLKAGCTKPFTNIRMASLSANARFLDFFVQSVMKGKDITVTAPHQYASIMDAEDAVRGILSIGRIPISERAETYNLGPGSQLSILEFAQLTNKVGQQMGHEPVHVDIQDLGIGSAICMDCRKIAEQTGWEAIVSSEMMIRQLFRKYESVSHD